MIGAELLRDARGRRNGVRAWRLVMVRCSNGAGAPLIDDAWTVGRDDDTENEKWRARGKAISLTRKRNQYGERERGPALFVGRIRG